MIRGIIDRPEVLKNHQEFFNNLFCTFGELMYVKTNNSADYDAKYKECRLFLFDCEFYFYTKVATPSPKYDKAVCEDILSHLNGVI